jgi:hypothetical protein
MHTDNDASLSNWPTFQGLVDPRAAVSLVNVSGSDWSKFFKPSLIHCYIVVPLPLISTCSSFLHAKSHRAHQDVALIEFLINKTYG